MSLPRNDLYEFGPYRLEPAERRLLRDGQEVSLPPKAFDVLVVLVSRADHLVSKDDLLKEVWPDTFVEEASLSYTVSVLRKALQAGADQVRYIDTVQKLGYRFTHPLRTVTASGSRGDIEVLPPASPLTDPEPHQTAALPAVKRSTPWPGASWRRRATIAAGCSDCSSLPSVSSGMLERFHRPRLNGLTTRCPGTSSSRIGTTRSFPLMAVESLLQGLAQVCDSFGFGRFSQRRRSSSPELRAQSRHFGRPTASH